jgi:outer membrane protein OmpA-like peptidoglycan-associated protein
MTQRRARADGPSPTVAAFAPLVLLAVVACAGTRMPPKELNEAREEVMRARETASQLEPTGVHEAEVALNNAERAWQRDPDSPSDIDLALVAMRTAQIAEVQAQTAQALNRASAADQQTQALAASQLESARGQLGQTERQLDQTQDELHRQQQGILDMENKLKDARATIAKIASVRDDDRGMVITLQGELLFKTGKWDLKPTAMAKLDQIAEVLRDKEQPIRVVGYTDDVGERARNMDLSQKRADTVSEYLVDKGIPRDLVHAEGKGPDSPAADNTSIEGRAANRRVELIVEPKK